MTICKVHHERPYIAGVANVYWDMWAMLCDALDCEAMLETAEYDDLPDKAALAGWLVMNVPTAGAQWHYCPTHRDSAPAFPKEGDTQFREEP